MKKRQFLIDVFQNQTEKKKISQAEEKKFQDEVRKKYERKILQEKDLFKNKLSDIRESIKNKSPQIQIELLEHFINEENTIILDDLIGFLMDYTPLYSPRYTTQIIEIAFPRDSVFVDSVQYNTAPIIEDIKAAGGIFQFYKSISNKLDLYWSLTEFTDWRLVFGWMWLLAETTNLYDRAIFEMEIAGNSGEETPPKSGELKENKEYDNSFPKKHLIKKSGNETEKNIADKDYHINLIKNVISPDGRTNAINSDGIKKAKYIFENIKSLIEDQSIIAEKDKSDKPPYRITGAEIREKISLSWDTIKSIKPKIKQVEYQQLFSYNGETFNLKNYRSNNKRH